MEDGFLHDHEEGSAMTPVVSVWMSPIEIDTIWSVKEKKHLFWDFLQGNEE